MQVDVDCPYPESLSPEYDVMFIPFSSLISKNSYIGNYICALVAKEVVTISTTMSIMLVGVLNDLGFDR
jgi:hypothetical protein